jgi:aspartokinase
MVEKVNLEGMTATGALVRVNIVKGSAPEDILAGFLRSLAQKRINMRLLIGSESHRGVQASCCVADGDGIRVKTIVDSTPDLKECTELQGATALVSIFPHRSNLKTVGLALIALAEAGLPLYGLCSSLSALTFITDHARLQEVFTALQTHFDFNSNPPRMAD